jgi:hypothetical protein
MGEGTFAGTHANDGNAPIPAIGELPVEHRGSTQRRHSTIARIICNWSMW